MSKEKPDPKVQHPGGRDKNESWVKSKGVWRKIERKDVKKDESKETK